MVFWFQIGSEFYDEDDMPYLYSEAEPILHALKDKGVDVAIASRSPTPEIAKIFLAKLGIQSMLVAQVSPCPCDE